MMTITAMRTLERPLGGGEKELRGGSGLGLFIISEGLGRNEQREY
jgi:hypothetical protein